MSDRPEHADRVVFSTGFLWKTPLGPYLDLFPAAGFRKLEAVFVDAAWSEEEVREVVRAARERGLVFYSLHAPFVDVDLTAPDPDLWKRSLEKTQTAFRMGEILGVRVVVIHPSGIYSDDRDPRRLERIREALEILLPEARAAGLRIAVENMMPRFWGRRLEDLVALMRDLPEEVGVCMDTSHLVMSGIAVSAFWDRLGDRVIHTHLSDNWGEGMDDHILPDENGRVPWDEVMGVLRSRDIPLTFEIYNTYGDIPFAEFLKTARERIQRFLKAYAVEGRA